SGTYAGYKIDSGRLSVQLVYTLEDGLIRGTNHIVVNQLQLGEQISGPKVRDLPLRFAIYLLTDANGVMDLGVDVTGSVDDPDFSVGSIIWKAFRNLIVKTAASPFRALANLVGGADRDNLDRVSFAPGSDVIAAGESHKLKQLTAALNQKPALKLSIRGHISPSQDIEALRDAALSQQLIAEGDIAGADIQQQSAAWQEAVKDLFRERFPERKSEPLQTMQMNDAMRDNIELPSSALLDLATRRGLALKQALIVEHCLAADRARKARQSDVGQAGFVRAVFRMEGRQIPRRRVVESRRRLFRLRLSHFRFALRHQAAAQHRYTGQCGQDDRGQRTHSRRSGFFQDRHQHPPRRHLARRPQIPARLHRARRDDLQTRRPLLVAQVLEVSAHRRQLSWRPIKWLNNAQ